MDKNKIKSFAIWARRNLIAAVSEKANRIGISENKIEEATAVQGGFKLEGIDEIFPLSKSDRDALVSQVKEKGFEQVMEEVAYTWFNRFMGLRYMEVNDYLPTGVRILSSSVEGKIEPDVLTKVSEIIDELGLNPSEIYDLLDTGDTLDREKAYRIILVKQCNELGKIIPQMFERISDYTELLLPDNLLEDGSVIRKMVEDIEESDWLEEVEIIGWMYQYYISEKKDEVFASLKKNVKITKENIPAATQLFTPKWIVKYMVENSLGRLWLEGHPNEELQKEFKYYLEEAEQEPEVEEELQKIREEHAKLKPEDIKVLDPCMGSGHILVYAFDVLYEIYKAAGYSEREIPRMILQNNIYGLDIDDRAAQLASFALIMKARHYNRRLFREIEREHLELNLCSIQDSNNITEEIINYFEGDDSKLRGRFKYLVDSFIDAKEYGSILQAKAIDFKSIEERLYEIESNNNLIFGDYRDIVLNKVPKLLKQLKILTKSYEICITNPPYMGIRGMGKKLSNYIQSEYSDSKSDLFALFIERCYYFTKKSGFQSMITQQAFMFLSSFNALRNSIYNTRYISSMLHLGYGAFGADFGTTSFVMRKNTNKLFKGVFIDLGDVKNVDSKNTLLVQSINEKKNIFNASVKDFEEMPNEPMAYWLSENYKNIFRSNVLIRDICDVKAGMKTGDNKRFLRYWHEISIDKMKTNCECYEDIITSKKKWFPYNKGGNFRMWYGNHEYVINMENGGQDIISQGREGDYRLRDSKYYFLESLSWSFVTAGKFSIRYYPKGFLCDVAGSSLYPSRDKIKYIIGMLASNLTFEILKIQNPTLNFQVENISNIPMIIDSQFIEEISELVNENIEISKKDWDLFESSWGFVKHPLINNNFKKINQVFDLWEKNTVNDYQKVKTNEVTLNTLINNIYKVNKELTSEVDDKYITIRVADRERDIKSLISYAVGCMFGRYAIDSDGLVYAGGDFNDKWNIAEGKVRKVEKDDEGNMVSNSWSCSRFIPDSDNIIPITEDEYFEDDIVSRFIEFLRTVYKEEALEENLDFVADSIGRKTSETSRQAIRRYFIKDFYKDHLKVYQKRPIYWMFESGKNDGFKCLVYMHRYDEQTVAKVRTDYLHTLQRKYESEINRIQLVVDSEEYTAKDRIAAKKKIDRISKQLEECIEYDQVVAHLANEKISIDLDDGVKVNYAKFQDIKVINSKGKEVKMNLLSKI